MARVDGSRLGGRRQLPGPMTDPDRPKKKRPARLVLHPYLRAHVARLVRSDLESDCDAVRWPGFSIEHRPPAGAEQIARNARLALK